MCRKIVNNRNASDRVSTPEVGRIALNIITQIL